MTVGRGTNITSLLVTNVGKTDIGRYFCEASNPLGVETAIAELSRLSEYKMQTYKSMFYLKD